MTLIHVFLQRLQYFRAQIPRELLGGRIAMAIRSLSSQSAHAVNAIRCFGIHQYLLCIVSSQFLFMLFIILIFFEQCYNPTYLT